MVVPVKRQNIVLVLTLLGLSLVIAGCTEISTSSDDTTSKPKPGQVAVLGSNVIIDSPLSNQQVTGPVVVSGRVKAGDEDLVYIRIRDAQNFIMATSTVQIDPNESGWATYEATLTYTKPLTPTGAVDVYFGNPESIDSMNILSLLIRFADFENPTVQLYFSNIVKDPKLLDCSSVQAVSRQIPYSNNILGDALKALFKGPTDEEIKAGFVNNLPEGEVILQKIELATTTPTITLDFNQALQTGVAGSCRVTAIRAQIEETVKQFNGIESVIISIDGETKGILQP